MDVITYPCLVAEGEYSVKTTWNDHVDVVVNTSRSFLQNNNKMLSWKLNHAYLMVSHEVKKNRKVNVGIYEDLDSWILVYLYNNHWCNQVLF